jgi:Ricin-type beta-trefoil lectin domain.
MSWNATASDWSQRGADIDGEAAYDNSGGSVSMSGDGNVVAIGAEYNDGNGTNAGHVRVYGFIDFSDVPSAPPSVMPSSQPTTRAARTFQITSSYTADGFDDSGCSNICLTAMVTKIGQPLKMRPCTRDHPKQMWFLDDFDNLRLRQQPQFCLLYRRKEIMLGKCNLDGSTNRARFFIDTSRGMVFV